MKEILNPYIAGAPVAEARMFFGREDVFDWIRANISGQYAEHILVIHGQRRVGKTSILKQLSHRLPDRFVQVFFDLQGRTHTTLDRFLWWMARETVRVLNQQQGIEIAVPDREAFAADPEYFEQQFLPAVQKALGEKVLLFTFDEFDSLEDAEVRTALTGPLINILQRLMSLPGVDFIFSIGSAGRKLENMKAAYTQFFRAALYRKISFLSQEDTRELITRPVEGVLEYTPQAIDRIYDITNGHPYFTQLICHELFARCQKTGQRQIGEQDVEAVQEDAVERGTVNLKFIWDEATDLEKWALAALATLGEVDQQTLSAFLHKQRVHFTDTDLTSALLRLREKDVLTENNRFVVYLMRLWLKRNRPMELVREELTKTNPIASRYLEIGMEYQSEGRREEAIQSFRKALELAHDNVQAHLNLAQVYMEKGAFPQAAAEFERVLQLDEDEIAARSGLCEAYLALGDAAQKRHEPEQAIQYYERALKINPEHTDATRRLAALINAERSRRLAEYYQQAQAAIADQQFEHATELLKVIQSVDPHYRDSAHLLARLQGRSKGSRHKPARAWLWLAGVASITAVALIAVLCLLSGTLPALGLNPAPTYTAQPTLTPWPTHTRTAGASLLPASADPSAFLNQVGDALAAAGWSLDRSSIPAGYLPIRDRSGYIMVIEYRYFGQHNVGLLLLNSFYGFRSNADLSNLEDRLNQFNNARAAEDSPVRVVANQTDGQNIMQFVIHYPFGSALDTRHFSNFLYRAAAEFQQTALEFADILQGEP